MNYLAQLNYLITSSGRAMKSSSDNKLPLRHQFNSAASDQPKHPPPPCHCCDILLRPASKIQNRSTHTVCITIVHASDVSNKQVVQMVQLTTVLSTCLLPCHKFQHVFDEPLHILPLFLKSSDISLCLIRLWFVRSSS